jgi:methionine sulfoxide reductase catalytic subunit
MLIKKPDDIRSSEITSKSRYLTRRQFVAGAATAGAAAAMSFFLWPRSGDLEAPGQSGAKLSDIRKSLYSTSEKPTSFKDITNYNNYYEFSADKYRPNGLSAKFQTRPWTVSIDGLVRKPHILDIDSVLKAGALEDRVYRHRCVEGWSMVIPWIGFPLSTLLKQVEPMGKASFVAFETILAPDQMPNQKTSLLQWPYCEGLRLDEAMHPLTIMAVGLYGRVLPNVDGAPLRLVVPWKYGFKSIKAIVKISLVDYRPPTTWNMENPFEYGFYSNVNPEVEHSRYSQATERRIGELAKRPTLMFNGYADQVGSLYSAMDLRKDF